MQRAIRLSMKIGSATATIGLCCLFCSIYFTVFSFTIGQSFSKTQTTALGTAFFSGGMAVLTVWIISWMIKMTLEETN